MMRLTQKTINVLIGVLAAQAALAALLLMPKDQALDPFVTFDFAMVDKIRISGGKAQDEEHNESAIELSRHGEAWAMPGNLPVDASRIEALSEALVSDRATWPVASTSDAARRFEVTEDAFQRQLQLFAGDDDIATLYFGTSPGFRRIHAREADSDKIYSIELANYDLPLEQDDWLDKSVVEAPASIEAIGRPGLWTAELDGEGEWTLLNSSLVANSSELASMATRFETLRVMGISEDIPDRQPDVEFEVTAAGVDVRYAFYQPLEEEDEESDAQDEAEEAEFSTSIRDTLVKSSLRDEYFRISSFSVDQLDKTLEDLVQAVETPNT